MTGRGLADRGNPGREEGSAGGLIPLAGGPALGGAPAPVDILRTCPLLSALDEPTYADLLRHTRRRRFRRNEVIFHAGDPGDSLLVIESGVVKVVVVSDDGDEAIVLLRHPGDHIGALSLLDRGPREMTSIALEPSELRSIPGDLLLELIDANLDARRALHDELAATIRTLSRRVADLEFLALAGRVASRLVDLAHETGGDGPGAVLPWHYTQADLASMVGGSRQRVNQILGDLASQGLLRIERGSIVIPDVDALLREIRR